MVFSEVYIIEIWKDIDNYEGYYQINNYGQVKSLDRYITRKDGVIQFKRGKLLTPIENDDGYYQIKLCKNGKSSTYKVHKLVAETFLDKPDDYVLKQYEVNHKDYDRKNNHVDNLEWLTHSENIQHSSNANRYKYRDFNGINNPNYGNHKLSDYYKENPTIAKEKMGRIGKQNGRSIKIELFDSEMNYIKTFEWIGACAEYLKNNNLTNAQIKNIRTNINISIRENKKYLNHYYKKIA